MEQRPALTVSLPCPRERCSWSWAWKEDGDGGRRGSTFGCPDPDRSSEIRSAREESEAYGARRDAPPIAGMTLRGSQAQTGTNKTLSPVFFLRPFAAAAVSKYTYSSCSPSPVASPGLKAQAVRPETPGRHARPDQPAQKCPVQKKDA